MIRTDIARDDVTPLRNSLWLLHPPSQRALRKVGASRCSVKAKGFRVWGLGALLETFTAPARACTAAHRPTSPPGAATTLYCCLKAPPCDCYHFFQDCAASPNRLPQANDDQASQKLCARRLRAKKSPSKQSMRHVLRPAPREGGACAANTPSTANNSEL